MCIGLHVKYPLLLSDFNGTWIFWKDFRNTLRYQISWISVQWQPSFSRRTDMTNRVAAFRRFANAPKNSELHWTVRWMRLSTITSDYKHRKFRPQYPTGVGLEYKVFHATLSEVRWFEYQRADFNMSFFTSILRPTCFLFWNVRRSRVSVLTFRHRASCILGQAFHYSPENAFFTRWFKYDRDCLHLFTHNISPGHIWTTLYIQSINIFHYLIFAWRCIIDINNIDNELDATITAY